MGDCPHCGSMVVDYHWQEFNGAWKNIVFKRKKALRALAELKKDILRRNNIVKHGTNSKMGFRYGINKVTANSIKQYAVDFNGVSTFVKKILYI